jgi:transcriptional regulator with XRE-family HTH domain
MNTDTTKYIADKLKNKRVMNGLTQLQLAKKADMNPNAYAKIERGERRANTDTLEKICRALKVKSSDILPF